MSQLSLFGPDESNTPGTPPAPDDELLRVHSEAAAVAARVPAEVRFGTSSWSFPGWRGLVYGGGRTQTALARDGLREYAAHPLLRTVGIDRSYYAPIPPEDLERYASQLPAGFPCCAKAPAGVTSPVLFDGARRSTPNPDYMSATRLIEEQLEPFARWFRGHTGPFILEFPPSPRLDAAEARRFVEDLDRLLGALPRDFEYAVELRNRALLNPGYREVLARHGAGHVYNYWSFMPMPGAQAAVVPPAAGFLVVRLLLRPGTTYEDQREIFRPFNRIVEPDEGMRLDVTSLVRRGVQARQRVYVLVNNKAEGSSPLTIQALAAMLARGE